MEIPIGKQEIDDYDDDEKKKTDLKYVSKQQRKFALRKLRDRIKSNPQNTSWKKAFDFLSDENNLKDSFFWLYNSKVTQMVEFNQGKPLKERGSFLDEDAFLLEKKRIFEEIALEIASFGEDDFSNTLMRTPILIPFTIFSVIKNEFGNNPPGGIIEVSRIHKSTLSEMNFGSDKNDLLTSKFIDEFFEGGNTNKENILSMDLYEYILEFSYPLLYRLSYLVNNVLGFDPVQTRDLNEPVSTGIQKFFNLFSGSPLKDIYDTIVEENLKNPRFNYQTIVVNTDNETIILMTKIDDNDDFAHFYTIRIDSTKMPDKRLFFDTIIHDNYLDYGTVIRKSISRSFIERDPIFESLESKGESSNDLLYFALSHHLTSQQFDFSNDSLGFADMKKWGLVSNYFREINPYLSIGRIISNNMFSQDPRWIIDFLNQRFITSESNPLYFSDTPAYSSKSMGFQTVFEMLLDRFILNLITDIDGTETDPFVDGIPNLMSFINYMESFSENIPESKFEMIQYIITVPEIIKDEKIRKRFLMVSSYSSGLLVKDSNITDEEWRDEEEGGMNPIGNLMENILIQQLHKMYKEKQKEKVVMNTVETSFYETLLIIEILVAKFALYGESILKQMKKKGVSIKFFARSYKEGFMYQEFEKILNTYIERIRKISLTYLLFYSFNSKSPYLSNPEVNSVMFLNFLMKD